MGQGYDVVILGAGYAGLMCAVRLAGKFRGIRIALVNRVPHFVERLRLHEGLADPGWVLASRLPLAEFLRGTGAGFVAGTVLAIDRGARRVEIRTTQGLLELTYARLVVALGSEVETRMVPGVAEHAYVLDPAGPRGAEVSAPGARTRARCRRGAGDDRSGRA